MVPQAGVVQADAKLQRVLEGGVLDRAYDGVQLVLGAVDKLLRALVGCCVCDEVQRGQARLPVRVLYGHVMAHHQGGGGCY